MSNLTVSLGVRALVYAHAGAERRERTSWGLPGRVRNEQSVVCLRAERDASLRAGQSLATRVNLISRNDLWTDLDLCRDFFLF